MFRGCRVRPTKPGGYLLVVVLILGLVGIAQAKEFTRGLRVIDRSTRVGVTVTCPSDTTVDCPDCAAPEMCGWATATGCDPNPALSYEDSVVFFRCPWEYTVLRTWTATDGCGDTGSCRQLIAVRDTVSPTITFCPEDVVAECGSDMDALGHAVAFDNRNPEPTTLYEAATRAGQAPCEFVVVRSWEFSDGCCNMTHCQQVVTMVDTEAPVLTCAPPDTFACDEEAHFTPPAVNECCDPSPVLTAANTDTIPGPGPGTYTKCWFATDRCGNVSNVCCQRIVIEPCFKSEDAPFAASAGGFEALAPERTETDLPSRFGASCHPNPLSGSTTISYTLPVPSEVAIGIFDIHGRKVASLLCGHSPAGHHSVAWNGTDDRGVPVASGMYVLKVDFDTGPDILRKLVKM
ncbi:MAG: FlgD immunoglobulin-like domain containing protein [Candidatus Eisenbacteria bacterium]